MDQPWRVRTLLIQGPPGPGKYLVGTGQVTPTYTSNVATFTIPVAMAAVGNPAAATADQALGALIVNAQVLAVGVVTVTLAWAMGGSPPALTGANWTAFVMVNV